MNTIRETWIKTVHQLQNNICQALEAIDGKAVFIEDEWERNGGGGGKTRTITNGNIFEKGGVNTSVVYGNVTDVMRSQLRIDGNSWFASGISLVIHPANPFVPTTHANYRMFEIYDAAGNVKDRWFGGGADLTPYYLIDADAIHFHQAHKNVLDKFNANFYSQFKEACDQYFVNTHRNNERRGIGGIFYDHQRASDLMNDNDWTQLAYELGNAFVDAYVPIVKARKNYHFNEVQKYWQEIRRGRYVEFNLLHDRGTIFGLKTNGRTESILMSLPPTVRFDYNFIPAQNSPEAELLEVLSQPKNWLQKQTNTYF